MQGDGSDDRLAAALRPGVNTLRIIVLAMVAGVSAFAGLTVVMRLSGQIEPAGPDLGVLTLLGFGTMPLAFAARWLVSPLVIKRGRRAIAAGTYQLPAGLYGTEAPSPLAAQGEAGKLFAVYQTSTIVAGALLEGAAFLDVTAFMLEGNWFSLGLAVILVAGIAALFPSVPRVTQWIAEQSRLMAEEKLLAPSS